MSSLNFDRKVWEFIGEFYENSCGGLDGKRKENQLEAYWCRKAGENQALFTDPKQRMFARFLRSYLNTTWHKVHLTCGKADKRNGRVLITDSWFEEKNPDIIQTAGRDIKENPFFQKEDDKDKTNKEDPFVSSCRSILEFIGKLELKNYNFEQEQTENFKIFSDSVGEFFNELQKTQKDLSKSQKVSVSVGEIFNELQKTQKDLSKSQKVSVYEKIIYENTCEPYQTIMKMQKLFPGFGIALSCDFLKESHLCNIAKPDIHLCHVFSLIDGIPYSMDLALVKRVAEFAANVCPADKNNFCGSGAYNVDKVIWQICSNYDVDNDTKKKSFKEDFLDELANLLKK